MTAVDFYERYKYPRPVRINPRKQKTESGKWKVESGARLAAEEVQVLKLKRYD